MQRPALFAAVIYLLCAQTFSSPIVATTRGTDSPTEDTVSPTNPNPPSKPCHIGGELEMNTSMPLILGDVPIVPDHHINIINNRYVPLRNCKELREEGGFSKSGLYVVQPGDGGEFVVYCDMTLLGGGWTIIQRRVSGKLSFNRSYSSYKNGFGDFAEDFWLGLDKISRLTNSENTDSTMEVYFGLKAFDFYTTAIPDTAFSRYSSFSVGNENDGYRLRISGISDDSTAGDSMRIHNNQKFSTPDRDQDSHGSRHCAKKHKGGWWYKNCHNANLNGRYYEDGPNNNVASLDGVSWTTWLGPRYSLKSTVIAIRPRE